MNQLKGFDLDIPTVPPQLEIKASDDVDTPSTSSRVVKLDSNTPICKGTPGERLNEWLFIINDAFSALEVTSDEKKLALVTNYVKGSVLNALIRYRSSEKNPTWKGFTNILKTQYEDTNLETSLGLSFTI